MSLPFRIVKLASPPDQVKAAVLSGDLVPYFKQSGIFTLGSAARYIKWSDQSDGSLLGKLGYFRSKNQCIYRFRMIFIPCDTGTELTLKVEHGPFSLILKLLLYFLGLCLCVVGVVFSFIGSSMIKRGQNYILQYLQGHLVDWDQARNLPAQTAAPVGLIPPSTTSDLLENNPRSVLFTEDPSRPVSHGTQLYPTELPSPSETSSVPVVDTGVVKGNSSAQNPSPAVTDPLKKENELDPDPTRQKSPIPLVIGVIAVLVITIYAVFHFTGNSQRVEQKWTSGSVAAKAVPNASINETLPPVLEKSSKNSPFSVSPDGSYSAEIIEYSANSRVLMIKKDGKTIIEESCSGFLLGVMWSPGGNYVAINERRGNSGDYLWIVDLQKAKVLKAPDNDLWRKMESRCISSLQAEAQRKWGADVEDIKDWGIAEKWEDRDALMAKVMVAFRGGSISRGEKSTLETFVSLKISDSAVLLQSTKLDENIVEEGVEQNEPPSIPVVPRERQRFADNAVTLPGEKFPQTRQRLLNAADIRKMTSEDMRYAINEMFARHGGTFGKQDVRKTFEKFNWYRPLTGVDFDHIEEVDFTDIEKANVKLLGAARDVPKQQAGTGQLSDTNVIPEKFHGIWTPNRSGIHPPGSGEEAPTKISANQWLGHESLGNVKTVRLYNENEVLVELSVSAEGEEYIEKRRVRISPDGKVLSILKTDDSQGKVGVVLHRVRQIDSMHAENQSGAEKVKLPVKASVVNAVKWNSELVGNIEVHYSDETKDRWTTKGSCGQPRVAADGTVGWTIFEPERPAQSASYNIRPNHTLVMCRKGKIICRVESVMGFVDEWDFLKDGKHFVVKSRALHGPATVELMETETGKVVEAIKASADNLPDWAASYHD